MPKWLKCTIAKGMFSDEVTVTVRSCSGEQIAVFVPRRAADDRNNLVQVKAFQHRDRTIAVLPDEHQSVIDVSSADVQPA